MSGRYYRLFPINALSYAMLIYFTHSYRRSQLYNIVTDVDSYPHFLPFCTNARILSKSATLAADAIKPAGIQMEAEMTVGFMAFKETYISNVYCIENESVEVSRLICNNDVDF